jgi:hypothetical protein
MTKRVHRLATEAEKARCPGAHTFNAATRCFHNRAGFRIDGQEPMPEPERKRRRK